MSKEQAGEWVPTGDGAARWYEPTDRAAMVYALTGGRWAWWVRSPWGGASWVVTGDGCATKEEAQAAADAWLRARGYLPAEQAPEQAPAQAGEWVPDGCGAARWYAPNDRAARVYEEARGRWAWWVRPPWGEASWVVVASGLNGSGLRDTKEEAMAAVDAVLRERGHLPAAPEPAPAPAQAGPWVLAGDGATRYHARGDSAASVCRSGACWRWAVAGRRSAVWSHISYADTREEAMAAADAWLRERGYLPPAEPEPEPAPPPPPPPEIHPDPAVAGTVRRELLDAIRDCVLPAAGIGPVTSREPDYARGALLYLAYRALKDDDREHVGAMALLLADVDKLVAGGWDYERAGKVLAAIHLVYGGLL